MAGACVLGGMATVAVLGTTPIASFVNTATLLLGKPCWVN